MFFGGHLAPIWRKVRKMPKSQNCLPFGMPESEIHIWSMKLCPYMFGVILVPFWHLCDPINTIQAASSWFGEASGANCKVVAWSSPVHSTIPCGHFRKISKSPKTMKNLLFKVRLQKFPRPPYLILPKRAYFETLSGKLFFLKKIRSNGAGRSSEWPKWVKNDHFWPKVGLS